MTNITLHMETDMNSQTPSLQEIEMNIVESQEFRCANKPGTKFRGVYTYQCPLWKNNGIGCFDESGYKIFNESYYDLDSLDVNNEIDLEREHIQAYCPMCYAVKKKYYMMFPYKEGITNSFIHSEQVDDDDINEIDNETEINDMNSKTAVDELSEFCEFNRILNKLMIIIVSCIIITPLIIRMIISNIIQK